MTGNDKRLRTGMIVLLLIAMSKGCHVLAHTIQNVQVGRLANYVRSFICFGLLAAWSVSVKKRVLQVQVRRILLLTGFLMIFWLAVREVKYRFVIDPDAIRFLWYMYYIPLLLIPLLIWFVSMSLGRPASFRLPGWTAALIAPTVLLILTVLSNDYHQLVFCFPPQAAVWSEQAYQYGTGYYACVLWGMLCVLASMALMVKKCRIPGSRHVFWLPMIPFAVAICHILLYVLQVSFIRTAVADIAVFYCLVFTGFFESCIQCGLIPSNTRYSDLFAASVDIRAQIADLDYHVQYRSQGAQPVSAQMMRKAEEGPLLFEPGWRLHNMAIRGGYAIWTEDISGFLALKEKLEDRQEELRERHAFLQREYDMEAQHCVVKEQNRLYDLLQSRTQSQIDRIDSLVQEYQREKDGDAKQRILSYILILGSYIKRRKDFVLSMDDEEELLQQRLASAFGESFRALSHLGIKGSFLVQAAPGLFSSRTVTLAYDFFEDVMESVLEDVHYLNVRVCCVMGKPRISILVDSGKGKADLWNRYPGMYEDCDEEDGTAYLLALDEEEGGRYTGCAVTSS